MHEKSAPKSAAIPGRPFQPGHDPRRGRGPERGSSNAGRPPTRWREQMEALADRWLQAAVASRIVDDPTHPLWMAVGRFVVEHAHGRPASRADRPDEPGVLEIVYVDAL